MSESVEPGVAVQRPATGVESVDGLLEAVEQLEHRPLEEHVGVFEEAHDRLRGALDVRPPGPGAPGAPS